MAWISKERVQMLEAQVDYYKKGVTDLNDLMFRLTLEHKRLQKSIQHMVNAADACDSGLSDRIDALQTEVDLRMKARISSILQVNSKLSKLSEALGLIWDPEKGDYVANKPKKATRKAK